MPESARRRDNTLQLVQEFGGIGFWEVDIGNNDVFWSEKVFEIHGLDPEDVDRERAADQARAERLGLTTPAPQPTAMETNDDDA